VNIIQVPSPNHYAGRNGYKVDRITLHIMAGYRAGTASIFSNPNYQASSTYGVGGDGRIDQYVSEADGAWADGSYDSNCRTISIEHEGGLDFIPCTQACLDASARLCADIARRYGWGKLVHGVNVFLHREVPPHTHPACPDQCPNGLNWAYIINKANQLLNGGDTDMTNAGDIWNYPIGSQGTVNKANQLAWVRLSWMHNDTARLVKTLLRNDDGGTKDGTSGDLYTRVCYIDNRVRQMTATITAQAAAIEALSKALGSNPADIAKAVGDAVKAKLDATTITMRAEEKK
jgi:hypothetical protein